MEHDDTWELKQKRLTTGIRVANKNQTQVGAEDYFTFEYFIYIAWESYTILIKFKINQLI